MPRLFLSLPRYPNGVESLSIAEAAQLLGVEPALVIRWIESGRLEAAWSFGPHGPQRSINRSVALAFQAAQVTPGEAGQAPGESDQANVEDKLARARAVEDYTAGLAATAIAPAVARLVETIERLIAENGNLREETGRLKGELAALNAPAHEPLRSPAAEIENPKGATSASGLTAGEWSALEQRIDRLAQPPAAPERESAGGPSRDSAPQDWGREPPRARPERPNRRPGTKFSRWLRRFLGRV